MDEGRWERVTLGLDPHLLLADGAESDLRTLPAERLSCCERVRI